MLHRSKTSSRTIILRIHCPLVTLSDAQAQEVSPILLNTERYLDELFGIENVVVERNAVISQPSQWYGRYENIETIMRGDHTKLMGYRLAQPKEEEGYEIQAVQANAGWNLDRIDMRFGLLDGQYTYVRDGAGVDIYVMDTGVLATHVDFEGRATFLHNAIPDRINRDCNGHGTHVAGIAASRTYGVAKKASIFGVRVLNCSGDGTVDDILEGADVIIERASTQGQGRRAVINLSLGGDRSSVIDNMIMALREHNIVVVLAAGNAHSDACQYSPSRLGANKFVLTVAASNRFDQRPSFSNYGRCVSLSAGGVDIASTWIGSNTAAATVSGTSMSAPAVTGVAALVLQQRPDLSVSQVNAIITAWATPHVISSTTAEGGGHSMLYSLIDANVPVDSITPPPTMRNSASGGDSANANGLVFCIISTLVYLLCLC
ncbi:MAG: S8 family peptidase [Planctomycetaceae bacterium]|nr:MAG: S8 family peptidase [Planctomycetaceae bacterium]